jgi:hypothetical protein
MLPLFEEELTEEDYQRLIKHRGGCICFVSAPCSRCSDPCTIDEADILEFWADMKADKLEDEAKALKNINFEDGGTYY